MDNNYNIYDDHYFERYLDEKDLADETQKNYAKQLNKFCVAVKKPLTDIIEVCKDQQSIEIEEIISSEVMEGKTINQRKVTKFDVNSDESYIKNYFTQFENYCRENGNKNSTINSGMDCIKAVLSHFNVVLPNWKNLPNDAENWNLLSKEDFKFVLADSSLMHKSLITFMLSTGFRITDCLNITIGDFMEATSDYHDFIEVDDFIDNAPMDMMGYWDFTPHKTEKKNIICKTFNSPESSNFIIQNLRRVKNEYLPRKFKKGDKRLKLSKSDFIFGSKRSFYKTPPLSNSISTMYGLKNKKLYDWHINKIKQDIKDGKISSEDYEKQVALIPLFHPHSCRKYFCTIIERHCANERRYRLMEGHSPSNKIDNSYINIAKDEIKEVYDEAVCDLSIYYTGEQDVEKLREDFEQQLHDQKEKYQTEIDNIKQQHQAELLSVKEELKHLDHKIEQSRTSIPMHRVDDIVISYLLSIDEIDSDKSELLRLMVWEYAKNNPKEFKDDPKYLFELVQKLDFKAELSNKDFSKQSSELKQNIAPELSPLLFNIINSLLDIIKNNEKIMSRIGYINTEKFDYVAEEYLIKANLDLQNISEDELNKLAGEVLIKYLDYK